MDIDHIFIRSQYAAPEAELLQHFGLTEASPNKHAGQGTANRRFFFQNLFLELLYLDNADDAQSVLTQPTQLYERLHQENAHISPFGVCFRPHNQHDVSAPFLSWQYRPAYLPSNLHVDIAQNLSLSEPMWFFLSFATRPDHTPLTRRPPLKHANGLSEVSAITLHMPKLSTHLTRHEVQHVKNFTLVEGKDHLLELTFDHGVQGLSHDFRPNLPLIFHY